MAAWPMQPQQQMFLQQQMFQQQQQQLMQQQFAAKGMGGAALAGMAPGISGMPAPMQAGPPAAGPGMGIVVTGCQNQTVNAIIKGSYQQIAGPEGSNHGKPVFRKTGVPDSVLIYFWDKRDGPRFSGWWFGPKVGGDQVWAYNLDTASLMPPASGWQVPWDGPVDDTLRLIMDGSTVSPRNGLWGAPMPGKGGWMTQEQKPRQFMDPEQKRREEEEKRRQAELMKKREEEDARRQEQAAALVVRKLIQSVRNATPDNFAEVRAELERAQAEQLEKMGTQAEKVLQEAEKATIQAQERIDQMNEKRLAEERRKQQEEEKRKEEEARLQKLAKEAAEEVDDTEKSVAQASELGRTAVEVADDVSPEAMLQAAQTTEEAVSATQVRLDAASQALVAKRREMGDSALAIVVLKTEIRPLFSKLACFRRTVAEVKESTKGTKEKAERKAAALKKEHEQKDIFKKYDKDGDDKLNRDEITSFCQAQYEFCPDDEHLERILKALADGEGVPFDKFQRLRSMVAIAKSEVKAREKRLEEEEKERIRAEEAERRRIEVEAKRKEFQEVVDGIDKHLREAESAVAKADAGAKLSAKGQGELSISELREAASETEAALKAAKEVVDSVSADVHGLEGRQGEAGELRDFLAKEVGRLRSEVARLHSQLDKGAAAVRSARERAARKQFAETEELSMRVAAAMRDRMGSEGKSSEEFFEHLAGGSAGEVACDGFVAFVKSLPALDMDVALGERLFQHICEGAIGISKDRFIEMIRLFYKVVKDTILTESMPIRSKTLRRLELGETVEMVEVPKTDEEIGITRVMCRTVKDNLDGWVTVQGNHGTTILEPGGNSMKCVKETIITDGLSVADSKTIRKISKGEMIDVIEFAKKDASVDVMRVKAKAKHDSVIGWVTVAGNAGTTFLVPC